MSIVLAGIMGADDVPVLPVLLAGALADADAEADGLVAPYAAPATGDVVPQAASDRALSDSTLIGSSVPSTRRVVRIYASLRSFGELLNSLIFQQMRR
jgi:hypothetical protein